MEFSAIALIITVQLVHTLFSSARDCQKSRESQYGFVLLSSYKKLTKENLETCHRKCIDDKECSSINYNTGNEICEHNHVTKHGFPLHFVQKENSVYAEVRDPDYGSSKNLAVSSCKRILELHPKAKSGIYWIRLGIGSTQTLPFQVYCNMQTDGGGWTLVYSYRFLNFASFTSSSNAVSPVPNWPINPAYMTSGISTTVPLSETSYAAMDFKLWKEIGTEFLIKPNITHWVSCVPVSGDLVNWKVGSLTCKVVKNVATVCLNNPPTQLKISNCGVGLNTDHLYFFFEGSINSCWPVHDSCGSTSAGNHLTYINPPGGALYIR